MKSTVNVTNDLKTKVIGRCILIFFGVILLLTFFSNTINNYTIPKVKIEKPYQGSLLKKISGEGELKPINSTDIYIDSDISCRVQEVMVKVGNRVKKGDQLVALNKKDIEAKTKIENLAYEKLKLIYKEMLDNYNTNANLNSLKLEVDIAKEDYIEAENKLKSVKELFDLGIETLVNYISIEKNYKCTKIAYESKLEQYKISKSNELSSIKQFELDMKVQKEKIVTNNSSSIVAPYDGIISEVNVSKGSWINAATKLISITNDKEGFEFIADVDFESAKLIKPKQESSIRISALGTGIFKGKVISIGESKNSKGVKKEVVSSIIFPENKEQISGGEKGEIHIEKKDDYTILVSNAAIIPGLSDKEGYVRLVKKKNSFLGKEYYIEIKAVSIIDSDNTQTAIVGGITEDDIIVIKTDRPMKDQDRVLVVNQLEISEE